VTKLPELDPEGDQAFLRSTERPKELGEVKLRVVDLFSGCGGMTLGVVEAARSFGFDVEIVLSMELDKEIRAIYDANFSTTITSLRDDVAKRFDGAVGKSLTLLERATVRDVGEIDLLLGGPPCQGHSNLNNHTRRRDPKNALYLRMLRAVEVLKPRAVIIENVPDIRHATNHAVKRATNRLEALEYSVTDSVIAAAELGVPQRRTRHVLVAVKGPASLSAVKLETRGKARPRNLRWAIGDLEDECGEHFFRFASTLSPDNEARAKYLLRYNQYDLPNQRRPECHRDKPDHRYTSMYGRLSWDEPAQTITTGFGSPGQGRYLHPSRARTLTPHEAARLQFFPDWFDFSVAKHRRVLADSIGNAVPPMMSFALGRWVLRATVAAEAVGQDQTRAAL
jgi:DNA (cytosine-5)-methyltransferase 1